MGRSRKVYSAEVDPALGAAAVSLPLVRELDGGLQPWDVCRRLARLPHLLFLDSAARDAFVGRYSFISADPFCWIRSRAGHTEVMHISPTGSDLRLASGDPFSVLGAELARYRGTPVAGVPPFQGGAAGLFGYDLCHYIERLPRARRDEFEVPDLAVGLYDWVIAFDHDAGRAWALSTGWPEQESSARQHRAVSRLGHVLRALKGFATTAPLAVAALRRGGTQLGLAELAPSFPLDGATGVQSNFTRGGFRAAVARAVEYVHAGDCFQVNLSQRLLYPALEPALDLYGRLRDRNAAPFAGYFDLGDFVVASASPERLLRVQGDTVEARPIKGTRPRGRTPEQDRLNAGALVTSAKDRAENIMIVDLLRNDLGRVCAYGSVSVEALCRLESYRYVHHLVSVVTGRLRTDRTPIDLLRAAFPGGSVTGAPKIRAMEIIAELEPTARGAYCGSLGYLGFDGTMDTSILIRTFTVGRGWVQFPVGGGVVADSEPDSEYQETLHKAEGLLRALSD
jgi:para-aminobenzoate synthetase component 1